MLGCLGQGNVNITKEHHMRVGRVLDASDPRVNPPARRRRGTPRHDVRAGIDYPIRNPEDALLVRVNDDEGPLTSIDRSRLRAMGHTPWDERPGFDGQSYAQRHGVSHEELNAPEDPAAQQQVDLAVQRRQAEAVERLNRQHANNIGRFPGEPIRPAQESLIQKLLRELEDVDPTTYATAKPWCDDELAKGMTKKRASEVITRLKDRCGYEAEGWKKRADFVPAVRTEKPVVTVEGLYRFKGELYQVMRTDPKSARLVAKLITFVPGKKRPTLTYVKGMIFRLSPDDLVPAEEAQELTRKTGWCIFGHFLTNPVSIARGMGPKCWERYGG